MRWACATQPGLPALRNQFRLGISDHRSSLLFLVLGEFVGVSVSGFLTIKKFRLGISDRRSSLLFLDLGY